MIMIGGGGSFTTLSSGWLRSAGVTELSKGAKTRCAVNHAISHGSDNAKSKNICDLQESDMRMGPKKKKKSICESEKDERLKRADRF